MAKRRPPHVCTPPANPNGTPGREYGTVWGCAGCRQEWFVGEGCDTCNESLAGGFGHDGPCVFGWVWRPTGSAGWYRLEHWKAYSRRRNPVD
jgi:hypothetical protein